MKLNGEIGAMGRKWNNRKIEQHGKELQKAADNNMKPLRAYQKSKKTEQQSKTLQYTQKTVRKHTTPHKH